MTWAVVGLALGFLTLAGAVGGVFYWLRWELKQQGRTEVEVEQAKKDAIDAKKANESKDEVNKLSDSAVADWLSRWNRK